MIVILVGQALAASATDAPGAKQADFTISSRISSKSISLLESNETVGKRSDVHHELWLSAEYGIIDQVSVAFGIPHYFDSLSFSDSAQMEFDPLTRTGTYINSNPIDDFSRTGSGLGGLWIGVYAYPFHQRFNTTRKDRGSWKIGIGYQLPDATPFQSVNEDGNRGGGPGAGALTLSGAFSTTSAFGEPYLIVASELRGVWNGDIRDDDGVLQSNQTDLRPATSLDCRFGNEVMLWKDIAYGSFVSMDGFGRLSHQSHQDIPTNVYLPSVLHAYKDYVVKQGELTTLVGGLGINMQFNSMYSFKISGELGQSSYQYIEHLYQINASPTLTWGTYFNFTYRLRNQAI